MGRSRMAGVVAVMVVALLAGAYFAGWFAPPAASPLAALEEVAPVVTTVVRVHDLQSQPAGEPVQSADGSIDPTRWRVEVGRGTALTISGVISPTSPRWGLSRMAVSSPPDWWDANGLGVANPPSRPSDPPLELLVVVATGVPPKSQHFNRPACWAATSDPSSRLFGYKLPPFDASGVYAVDVMLLTREPDSGVPGLEMKSLQRVPDRPLGIAIARYEVLVH